MQENKQEFLNKLCELLRMTRSLGMGNALKEIRYVKSEYGEVARPIFEDGTGADGCYDVNISGDSCIAILSDVVRQFVRRVW